MKLILFSITSVCFLALIGVFSPIFAQDFNVDTERIYTVDSQEVVLVTEKRTITNNSATNIISGNNNEVFQIIVLSGNNAKLEDSFLSAEAFVNGQIVQFQKGKEDEDSIEIVIPYSSAIGIGQSRTFEVRYKNYGLSEATGALFDIFAPGFSEGFKFSNNNTVFSFDTKVLVSRKLGEINFAAPESEKNTTTSYNEFSFSQESLKGTNVWIQVGTSQYYKFVITQEVKASEKINKGYYNEYKLVLPRDIFEGEIEQKVYFQSFDPSPKEIVQDEEGNLIATFKVLSSEDRTITIAGYAELSKTGLDVSEKNSGTLDQIDTQSNSNYLGSSEYWEVDASEIQQLGQELKGQENNVYEIIEKTYQHIVDTIDYSEVKRFGINERQGALKTLQGGAAVCMEYSDLFLALARAQNIPTRAAFGYGYDARLGVDQQEAHQWVQSYIPAQDRWISIDVTWGESGPTLIGGDLNHFYTHVASLDPNTPPSVSRTSYGNKTELEAPQFEISALKSIPEGEVLSDASEILITYPPTDENQLEQLVDGLTLYIQTANIPPSVSRNAQYVVYAGFGFIALAGVLFLKLIVDLLRKH